MLLLDVSPSARAGCGLEINNSLRTLGGVALGLQRRMLPQRRHQSPLQRLHHVAVGSEVPGVARLLPHLLLIRIGSFGAILCSAYVPVESDLDVSPLHFAAFIN